MAALWSLTGSFYLATRPFTQKNGLFLQQVLDTFSQADALTRSQREQSVKLLATAMGLPETVIASYLDHRPDSTISLVSEKRHGLNSKPQICFMPAI